MSASDLHPNLQPMFEEVLRRNPGESEFHQAVFELIHSLPPPRASPHSLIMA